MTTEADRQTGSGRVGPGRVGSVPPGPGRPRRRRPAARAVSPGDIQTPFNGDVRTAASWTPRHRRRWRRRRRQRTVGWAMDMLQQTAGLIYRRPQLSRSSVTNGFHNACPGLTGQMTGRAARRVRPALSGPSTSPGRQNLSSAHHCRCTSQSLPGAARGRDGASDERVTAARQSVRPDQCRKCSPRAVRARTSEVKRGRARPCHRTVAEGDDGAGRWERRRESRRRERERDTAGQDSGVGGRERTGVK